jgi:hypothetical protein
MVAHSSEPEGTEAHDAFTPSPPPPVWPPTSQSADRWLTRPRPRSEADYLSIEAAAAMARAGRRPLREPAAAEREAPTVCLRGLNDCLAALVREQVAAALDEKRPATPRAAAPTGGA